LYRLGQLSGRLPTNAIAEADSALNRLKRELELRLLNNYARDNATVRANYANKDRLFSAHKDYADRVESALEADIAAVSAKESYALCLPVAEDVYLSSLYNVCRSRASVFVSLANLAASSLKDAASCCEDLVRA